MSSISIGDGTGGGGGGAAVHQATTNPTVNDDSGDGYAVGQLWQRTDTTPDRWFILEVATIGAAVWRPLSVSSDLILFAKGGYSAVTGSTSEQTLETITIPAGLMGPDSKLQVEADTSCTANGNVKTIRAKIGGVNFLAYGMSTSVFDRVGKKLTNIGVVNAQRHLNTSANDEATTGGSETSQTFDFATAQTLTITGQLANSADSFTLRHLIIRIINPGV